jgi:hypothetical protein
MWNIQGRREIHTGLNGKPERDHLEKTRHKSGDNIKIDVTEIGCTDVDCIHQAEDRDKWQAVVKTEMNLLVT